MFVSSHHKLAFHKAVIRPFNQMQELVDAPDSMMEITHCQWSVQFVIRLQQSQDFFAKPLCSVRVLVDKRDNTPQINISIGKIACYHILHVSWCMYTNSLEYINNVCCSNEAF